MSQKVLIYFFIFSLNFAIIISVGRGERAVYDYSIGDKGFLALYKQSAKLLLIEKY